MLILAEVNNWKAVELSGAEEFKAMAWLEAQRRGIAVTGYKPGEDLLNQWEREQVNGGSDRRPAGEGGQRTTGSDVASVEDPGGRGRGCGNPATPDHVTGDQCPASCEGDSASSDCDKSVSEGAADRHSTHPGAEGMPSCEGRGGQAGKGSENHVRDRVRAPGDRHNGWDARFKQASAARRRDRQGADLGPNSAGMAGSCGRTEPLSKELIAEARQRSPAAFLRSRFGDAVTVNQRGTEIEVHGKLRVSRRGDHWVACGWGSEAIGDNVALTKFLAGGDLGFRAAIEQFLDISVPHAVAASAIEEEHFPSVPRETAKAKRRGRQYLEEVRGISEATIRFAEREGVLGYCENGLLCKGWDKQGRVRSASIRVIESKDASEINKRDLAGSDKSYAALLPGSREVVIVEGLVDGLAVIDMAARDGRDPPTIIITGGVRVRRWLQTAHLRALLAEAGKVTIMGENEVTPAIQGQTDRERAALSQAIAEISGRSPEIIYPPSGCKDVAEWNVQWQGQLSPP